MKCPHCLADLKYRDRRYSKTCPQCQRPFALEPRDNSLRMSDLRLRGLAERLSHQGAYRYTSAQLSHQLIRPRRQRHSSFRSEPLRPSFGDGEFWKHGFGIILVIVGSFLTFFLLPSYRLVPLAILFLYFFYNLFIYEYPGYLSKMTNITMMLAVATSIVILLIWEDNTTVWVVHLALIVITVFCISINEYHRYTRTLRNYQQKILNPPKYSDYRPVESDEFIQRYIQPWEAIHGTLPGRLTDQERAHLRASYAPPSQVRAVLASPVADVLDCLLANGLPERLGLALLSIDGLQTEADERIIALLRQRPRLPLLLIHDASVAGCLLPALLPDRWGLAPNHQVIDLGLRPRHVMKHQLPRRQEQVEAGLLDQLKHETKGSGRLALDDEELQWLCDGWMSSALFVPPVWIVTVVSAAVERLAQAQHAEQEAQAQARAVGFMTWPQHQSGSDMLQREALA
jgi:hypothetical protein